MQKGTYSKRWDQIVAMDVDGDDRDERMFYEAATGDYLVYRVNHEGRLLVVSPVVAIRRTGPVSRPATSIYATRPTRPPSTGALMVSTATTTSPNSGSIRARFRAGNYSTGWSEVAMVDYSLSLPGTELLLYRSRDGRAVYYDLSSAGRASNPTSAGYSTRWSQIVAADFR